MRQTRALSELEQGRIDRQRRDRAWFIRFCIIVVLVGCALIALVNYCHADVCQTSSELAGQRIARSITSRALRITNTAYLIVPPYAPGDGNVTESGAPRGGVCPDPAATLDTSSSLSSGAGTPPAPQSPYCDVDSDVLTRRDFIAADAETYGVSHDAALQAADWCIWLAQETGTTAFEWAACMAAESGYKTTARNRTSGCTGLLQIHPCHKKAMLRLGLDFNYEGDRIVFGAHLYQQGGWRPWSPSKRGRAKHKARLEKAWNSKTRE